MVSLFVIICATHFFIYMVYVMFSSFFQFFSTKAVKQKIQTDKLSQTQLFIYFYLITLFDFIGSTQQSLSLIGRSPTITDYLNI
jgi:hypothetical protein